MFLSSIKTHNSESQGKKETATTEYYYYYYYQLYQLGTGGRSQKDLACTRCLPKAIGVRYLKNHH